MLSILSLPPRNLPDNEDKHKIQKRASQVLIIKQIVVWPRPLLLLIMITNMKYLPLPHPKKYITQNVTKENCILCSIE